MVRCAKGMNSTSYFEGQKMLPWVSRALILLGKKPMVAIRWDLCFSNS